MACTLATRDMQRIQVEVCFTGHKTPLINTDVGHLASEDESSTAATIETDNVKPEKKADWQGLPLVELLPRCRTACRQSCCCQKIEQIQPMKM